MDFAARKAALKAEVNALSLGGASAGVLGDACGKETRAAARFAAVLAADTRIDPAAEVLSSRARVESSAVFQLLRKMPKGALLHTHGIATGPFEALVDILRADPRVYVFRGREDRVAASAVAARARAPSEGEGEWDAGSAGSVGSAASAASAGAAAFIHGEVRYLTPEEARAGPLWTRAGAMPAEALLALLRVPPETPRALRWTEFQHCWNRVRELSDSIPLWDGKGSYLWRMLEQLLRTGVTHAEFKQLVPRGWVLPAEDGSSVNRSAPIDAFMDAFSGTVRLFCSENPRFLGAKVVWAALKMLSPEDVRASADTALRLREKYPEFVAGFDLVGHEDSLRPIEDYAAVLEDYRSRGGRLLLHAGETVDPLGEQIVDALALGSERIGHALALARFPTLLRRVVETGVVVECCPCSNQCLGYVDDLRAHPAHGILNAGARVTISSDDAASFGYDDVTVDFAMAAKAWALSLPQLKRIARESLACSALERDVLPRAEAQFDADWDAFLDEVLKGD